MPTVQSTKQEAIKKLDELALKVVDLQKKQNDVLAEYNELLKMHFNLVEDGKPMTKMDTIRLIQKVVETV